MKFSRIPKQIPYRYILFIGMLFVTVDLAAVSMAYNMIGFKKFFQINSGATYIFPLTYCLGDIVTEVYGYKMARQLIWQSLILQFIYAIIVTLIIQLPQPAYWHNHDAYEIVFGSSIRFVLGGTIANFISSFMNSYLVAKLKIPFEGKLFWLRSILSTVVGGFFMVSIIILVGFYGKDLNLLQSWTMFKSTFALEIIYAFALALPAAFITSSLKQKEQVDVYDTHTNFNPFNFF